MWMMGGQHQPGSTREAAIASWAELETARAELAARARELFLIEQPVAPPPPRTSVPRSP
jgi:hypothetical protein